MDKTTTLICGDCGEGTYRPAPGDGMFTCGACGHYVHTSDITPNLDAGETLRVRYGSLVVVHGGEQ